jgi:hypothetical protein
MKRLWIVVLLLAGVAPARAFTCEDVRALSRAQQAYYIRAYNITPAQQERIRRTCKMPWGHGLRQAASVPE